PTANKSDHGGLNVWHKREGTDGRYEGSVRRGVRNAMLLAVALTGIAACARTSVENLNERAVGLPRPQLVIVHDFAVTPGDVALDGAIGQRLIQAMRETPATEQELNTGREVARIVSENLVKEINKLGIPTVS